MLREIHVQLIQLCILTTGKCNEDNFHIQYNNIVKLCHEKKFLRVKKFLLIYQKNRKILTLKFIYKTNIYNSVM